MTIGAKSVVILDRGVVASSSNYIPGSVSYNYDPITNSYNNVYTPGYGYTQNTSAYIVVFFKTELPYGGSIYTMDDYKEWKWKHEIGDCAGCLSK